MKDRLNNWINTHKYVITVTGVAVVSLLIIRNNSKTIVVGDAKQLVPDSDIYGYAKFG